MNVDLLIRMSAFFGVLVLMALWESAASRRRLSTPRGPRWFANISVVVLDTLIVRLLFATGAVGMAMLAVERHWGILNQVGWPSWLEILLAVILLDLVLFLQHVMFHAVPLFWRFHMMHHRPQVSSCRSRPFNGHQTRRCCLNRTRSSGRPDV
jgi:sterol desaturase/sphingolipid hydroxylase (fatty acid hydroxylase superfamily)